MIETCLVLWLIVGGGITWLMHDFNQALAPDRPVIPVWVIGSLFAAFAIVILLFFKLSSRKAL